ncbi:MAG: DUF1232 domain-containing protein [Chloroflexi bacterium]|nr:DUF1232 domain-containing protein [Chloroflexota bacterium]MCH8115861.1 DUF1232 domain-containing protein [Chloroflexota bacterium]MCI0775591.1 DUF1232 domain-containing protein [Chloroflexota bacterium]MCI0804747.1 DUF1232 domain-containing protein [Chloroflexota bacterium]MCI0809239.1 DUF1232 domain-containing protein [Chloroflexota bacterium]
MTWYLWLLLAAAAAIVTLLAVLWVVKRLRSKEPYASVLALGIREKIRFFRFIVTDKRVPLVVKLIPFLVAAYLINPFDLIPDFVPVLGYLDDVGIVVGGLALVVKLTPPELVCSLIDRAKTSPDRA